LERSRPAEHSFRGPLVSGGGLSAVTIPGVEIHLHERSLALAASRHSRRWTPSCDGEARMLVTEQDAVMKKWCPMIRLRWESRPFAYNRSNPGRSARFRNMLYRIFFPTPAPRREGAFLPMPGVGLHDVAMGDQRSSPTRAAQGTRVAWRRPDADISTLFGQAAGQCHIIGPLPRLIRRNFHAIQLGQ
jgi:hypothetical protein